MECTYNTALTLLLRPPTYRNDITYLAMLHLDRTRSTPTVVDGRRYYQFKADICAMVDREWWPRAWKKQSRPWLCVSRRRRTLHDRLFGFNVSAYVLESDSWGKNVAHVLAAQKTRYISGKTDSGFKEGMLVIVMPLLKPC